MPDDPHVAQLFKPIDAAVLLELGLIMAAAIALIVAVQRVLPWIGNRLEGQKRLTLLATIPFLRLIIILASLSMIVPLLIEPSVQNMVALLGTVGLAIGFALKDYVSSLIAGIVAIGEQTYRNGDWLRVGDVYGEVRHVGMRAIEVITPDDDRVLIPHALLWRQPIHNANNGAARLQCAADFYLHPAHDGQAVRKALEDVILTSPYLYLNAPAAVVVKEAPWGTQYRLKAYPVSAAQQFRFVTDLTLRGKEALIGLGGRFVVAPALPE